MIPIGGLIGSTVDTAVQQNPYTMSNFMYGSPYLMPGMFLPQQDNNAGTWVFHPSYLASIPRGFSGYDLPYGVAEGEYLGSNTQYFFDTTAVGAAHAANFIVSTFLGDKTTEKLFRMPLLSPRGFLTATALYYTYDYTFDKLFVEPFEETLKYGELYRQATSPIAIFSKDYDSLRQGIKRSTLMELVKETGDLAAHDYYLNQQDYNTLIVAASQTGILDATAGDVEQIKKAIKSLASGLKLYASLAKDPTIIDSMKELSQLATMGVNIHDLVNLGTTFAIWAKEAGYNYNQIAPYAQQAAMQYYGMGISPIHAMEGYMRNLLPTTAYSIALQQQGSPLLGMFGGREGILQQITSLPMGLMQSPLGQFYLAGLNNQQLFSGTISPGQVSDIFAFSNFNASIAMAHPFRTGVETVKNAIELVREATGTTNYFIVKNVLQQMGISPQQVDTIMYMALDADKTYPLEIRAASNTFTNMIDEYAIQNYPSGLRRLITGLKSFYHSITDPARDFAISLQNWYEDTISRFYYTPYTHLGFFDKLLYPIFSFFKPGLSVETGRPIPYRDYVSEDEVFELNRKFLKWIDSDKYTKADRYGKFLETVKRLYVNLPEEDFIRQQNYEVDETFKYVMGDGTITSFLFTPARAILALPKNIGLAIRKVGHDLIKAEEKMYKRIYLNTLESLKDRFENLDLFKVNKDKSLTIEDTDSIVRMVVSGKPNREVLNWFLPEGKELEKYYYLNEKGELTKQGEDLWDYLQKTIRGSLAYDFIKNKLVGRIPSREFPDYNLVKKQAMSEFLPKISPRELIFRLENFVKRYNDDLSNVLKRNVHYNIDQLKTISSAIEGITEEKDGEYVLKDEKSREKFIDALNLLYGDNIKISDYMDISGRLTDKGKEIVDKVRESQNYLDSRTLDTYKKIIEYAAVDTATLSTYELLGNTLKDVAARGDIKDKKQFEEHYKAYKEALEANKPGEAGKVLLNILNKDIDWNKLEKDESIDPYLKMLLKSPEYRREVQNYLLHIGITEPDLFKNPDFLHSVPIVHKLKEFAERKRDYEIQKELIHSLDPHTVRSLELNAQLLKQSMRESLDGALSKFSVRVGDDALKVVIVGDEINHADEGVKVGFVIQNNIGANP